MNQEKEETHEELWLHFGGGRTTMVDPPPLHTCQHEPGKSSYAALCWLLDLVEKGGLWKSEVRTILGSLRYRSSQAIVTQRCPLPAERCHGADADGHHLGKLEQWPSPRRLP